MSIYTAEDDRVIAYNANNWTKRWCVRDEQDVTPISSTVHSLSNVIDSASFIKPDPPAPPLGFNQPTEANGIIYVGSENGNTYAFKASDGTLLWQQNTGFANASAPTVEHGTVYIGSGSIYALNAQNGAVRWKYPTSDVVTSSPVLVNGIVYVSSYGGYVYALDAATGNLRWRFSVAGLARIYDTPTVTNGVVYFGTVMATIMSMPSVLQMEICSGATISYLSLILRPLSSTVLSTLGHMMVYMRSTQTMAILAGCSKHPTLTRNQYSRIISSISALEMVSMPLMLVMRRYSGTIFCMQRKPHC